MNMAAISRGIIKPHDAVKLFRRLEFILSRKLSKGGRELRKSQVDFICEALDPKNSRAWTSVFFPTEILYPFGIIPLSLEILSGMFSTVGLSEQFLDKAGSIGIPNTMCSFHRMLVGLAHSKHFALPELVGATSLFCDGNLKTFSETAKAGGVPFLFLDVPYEYNEGAVAYLKKQLEDAANQVAEIKKVKYSIEPIKEAVAKADEGLKRLKKVYELRKAKPQNLFRGHEMANFCFPSCYLLGSDKLIDVGDKLVRALERGGDRHKYYKRATPDAGAKRIMWMHIVPQYDTELWDLIDDGVRARVVCEEYTTPYFEGYDVSDPFGSIAKRLILHPSNGDISRRIENSIKIARDFKVDGVVHYSSWGCHQAGGNIQQIERAFEREGISFLNLNGDAVDKKNTTFGQHKTRIEAFLEKIA